MEAFFRQIVEDALVERFERVIETQQEQADKITALQADNKSLQADSEALRVENKADREAFQSICQALRADCKVLQADNKALWARCGALQKESENASKKCAGVNNDLSTRLTETQAQFGALQHSFAATDGYVQQLGEATRTVLQNQDARQGEFDFQQRLNDTLANIYRDYRSSSGADYPARQSTPGSDDGPQTPHQQTSLSPLQSGKRAMEIDELLPSPSTFRADSEAPKEFETLQPHGTSGVKRTASQMEASDQHKRSRSLQRKRAKSDLKKAGEAHALDTDDASSNIIVRPRPFATHVLTDCSPASRRHIKEMNSGMRAAQLFQSIGRDFLDMPPPAVPRRTSRDAKKTQAPDMVDSGQMVIR